MKSLLFLILLVMSSNVWSARIITSAEYESYVAYFKTERSLKPLINLIKSGEIESNIAYNMKPVFSKGKSSFLSWLLAFRLNKVEGYKGSTSEALELLQLLIDKGVDINQPQPGIVGSTNGVPLLLVSDVCSIEAFDILVKNKIDLSLYNNAFMNAILSQYIHSEDVQLAKDCEDIAAKIIPFTKNLDPKRIYKEMAYPESDATKFEHPVVFVWGDVLDLQFSERIKTLIYAQFGVKFSKMPGGSAPSDEWYNEFNGELGRPTPNNKFSSEPRQQYQDQTIEWWNKQSDNLKSWACYYSSFDEAIDFLLQAGVDKDWLTNQPDDPRAFRDFNAFGTFGMDDFRNYCNSLK